MNKNLKISYILMFIFSTILVAWQTLSNFCGGVGLNFVALVGIVFTISLLCFTDKKLIKRIKDLFIVACVFSVLELVIYFACEFGYGESLTGFIVYQNILSFFGVLFLAYICFRFAFEFLGKKVKFIEIMLGNIKHTPKEKKAKELTNGSLEDKPNNKPTELQEIIEEENENSSEEDVVIVETEE